MRTRASAIVGRDAELEVLRHGLDQAARGYGGPVFLVGEAGIGKTRLAETTTSLGLEAGLVTLRGRVGTLGPMVPFRPITEALLSLLRRGELDGIGDLGPYRGVLGRFIPEWATGEPQTQAPSIVVLAEALLRLLSMIGRDRGCLLVLEDLQAADAETLAIIEYLIDNLADAPILLLSTLRAERCDALDLATATALRDTGAVLELARLDRAGTCRVAASVLDVAVDALPEPLADWLWQGSAGVPFVIEELVAEVTKSGLVSPVEEATELALGESLTATAVPAAVVRSVGHRANRLGPDATRVLSLAAVTGNRFSLPVVREATGIDDRTLLATLHAGMAAALVGPDEPAPDWYAFRHPLSAEALLAALTPTERAELSRQAADAVERLHPDLDGDWCALVAELRLHAGELARAGRLYAAAGERALTSGGVLSAIAMLDRARRSLTPAGDPDLYADIVNSLVLALGETGQFDRAFELADVVDALGGAGLRPTRQAALHARLAAVGDLAARWTDASDQIAKARALIGPDAADEDTAPVDGIAAHLALSMPGPDRLRTAEELAHRAATAAERAPLPVVACEAWQLLGVLARERDLGTANAYFDRAERFAARHRLPIQRVYSQVLKAGTTYLADGSVDEMEQARQQALRIGALPLAYIAEGIIAMRTVLHGDYATAARMVDDCLGVASRMHAGQTLSYILVVKGTLAAHRGDRRGMTAALDELDRSGTGAAYELSLAYGLARTFCALLEEDRELAQRELSQALAYDAENPTTFHVAGKNGLALLLGVLAERAGWAHYETVTATAASTMRWNRQFVALARAVLLGREGRGAEAGAAVAEALEAAALFPMARHLGLRLVADEAHAHGWGTPVEWLREAENYFHCDDPAPIAGACRALLRQFGAPVRQRRAGSDRIPAGLRRLGVTTRELEVGRLLVERIGNKAIAERLFISPRTVEKHVASLLVRTQSDDREALITYLRGELG
ncbi:MAG TPA: AAA family ATPase [Kribbellaceae bacterium]